MARMRYPKQALDLIRKEDPDTQITLNFIRSLVYSGKIPCVKIGRRHLINVDALIKYIETSKVSNEEINTGSIRKVRE